MDRDELLKLLRGKITPHYYAALEAWTKKREYRFFGLVKRKFDVVPLHMFGGFAVRTSVYDSIHVYRE